MLLETPHAHSRVDFEKVCKFCMFQHFRLLTNEFFFDIMCCDKIKYFPGQPNGQPSLTTLTYLMVSHL